MLTYVHRTLLLMVKADYSPADFRKPIRMPLKLRVLVNTLYRMFCRKLGDDAYRNHGSHDLRAPNLQCGPYARFHRVAPLCLCTPQNL